MCQTLCQEPLGLVTRADDPEWSDFVNWVLQGLLAAEELGITQNTAAELPLATAFGEMYQNMFINAVSAVGNYGEMYFRHLENIVPRKGLNLINNGTGLIYSHPFGAVGNEGPPPVPGGTLETIVERGKLRCGTSVSLYSIGQAYCQALAAGIFGGFSGNMEMVNFTSLAAAVEAISKGDIDALSLEASLSLDVWNRLTFSQPILYTPR